MKEGRRLSEALEKCPRVAVRGVWYRSVDGEVFRGFYTATNPMRLGGAAAKRGLAGLLFESTKGAGACLVVFTDNLKTSGSRLEVKDGTRVLERLP
jgi:hypothetical protein